MGLDFQAFIIHDVTRFPFVVFNDDAAQPGYANQWEKEMVALMENGQPFVVVYDQHRTEESHEDRKRRGIWLKHNKAALGLVCKALIRIEPDEDARRQARAMCDMAVKAFGIPHEVAATQDEALLIAHRLTDGSI